ADAAAGHSLCARLGGNDGGQGGAADGSKDMNFHHAIPYKHACYLDACQNSCSLDACDYGCAGGLLLLEPPPPRRRNGRPLISMVRMVAPKLLLRLFERLDAVRRWRRSPLVVWVPSYWMKPSMIEAPV